MSTVSKQLPDQEKCAKAFILVAALAIIIAVTCYQLAPIEQRFLIYRKVFFESFLKTPWFFEGFWIFMAIHAVAMMGVLISFFNTREKGTFWQWHLGVGIIGYTLMCLTYVSRIYQVPKMAQAYVTGSDEIQKVIETYGILEFDFFNIAYGFPSLWFAVFGLVVLKQHRILGISAMCISLGYIVSIIGYLARISSWLTASSSAAFIFFIIFAVTGWRFFTQKTTKA
jgi:hypothetical protein